MTPLDRVQTDLKEAMKARAKDRVDALRLLLTMIKNEQIATSQPLDEEAFAAVVKRSIKQRRDAAEQYKKGGREELAAKEEAEVEILADYMPAQASEAEIRAMIEAYVKENDLQGPQSMGALMGAMMGRLGATADGATVKRIALDVLTPGE